MDLIELENDGNRVFYDLYKLFRPDTHLPVADIIHKDAKIKVVDRYQRVYNIIGFNMHLRPDEIPYNKRSESMVFKTDIQKRADRRITEELVRYHITKDSEDKYTMPEKDLLEYNVSHKTKYRTAVGVVRNIDKRSHALYIDEMIERYQISMADPKNPMITNTGLDNFNNDHGVHCFSVHDVLHEIKRGFVPARKDEGELIKIYPYGKICISRDKNNIHVERIKSNKYISKRQVWDRSVSYIDAPEKLLFPNSNMVRFRREVTMKGDTYHIKETSYNKQGVITTIREARVPKSGSSIRYTLTHYNPILKDLKNGVMIPKDITRRIVSEQKWGVIVNHEETSYDKGGRVLCEKIIKLNPTTMWQFYVDRQYASGRLITKTVKNPCDSDPFGYTYEAYDKKGRVIRTKTCGSNGEIVDSKQAFAIMNALDVYESCANITSGAKIRIYDLDRDMYLDWSKLIKDPKTQDVLIVLDD